MSEGDKLFADPDGLQGGSESMTTDSLSSSSSASGATAFEQSRHKSAAHITTPSHPPLHSTTQHSPRELHSVQLSLRACILEPCIHCHALPRTDPVSVTLLFFHLRSALFRTACFFHVFFKCCAVVFYLLSVALFNNFIIGFVACVLVLAFDFWTVKNVTGRLLVGLRWWNEVRDDGTNVWVFESKPDARAVNKSDSFWFWSTLWATPVVWCVFGIAALFSLNFSYLLIVAVAVALSGANVIGYWKCQKDASSRIQSFTQAGLQNWIVNRLTQQAMGGGQV